MNAQTATSQTARPPLDGVRRLIGRHEVLAFFVGAFVISWSIWVPLGLTRSTSALASILLLIGGFGPIVAAFWVVWLIDGREGVRRWVARMVVWRFAIGWYALAALGIPLLVLGGFGLYVLSGGDVRALT